MNCVTSVDPVEAQRREAERFCRLWQAQRRLATACTEALTAWMRYRTALKGKCTGPRTLVMTGRGNWTTASTCDCPRCVKVRRLLQQAVERTERALG